MTEKETEILKIVCGIALVFMIIFISRLYARFKKPEKQNFFEQKDKHKRGIF